MRGVFSKTGRRWRPREQPSIASLQEEIERCHATILAEREDKQSIARRLAKIKYILRGYASGQATAPRRRHQDVKRHGFGRAKRRMAPFAGRTIRSTDQGPLRRATLKSIGEVVGVNIE